MYQRRSHESDADRRGVGASTRRQTFETGIIELACCVAAIAVGTSDDGTNRRATRSAVPGGASIDLRALRETVSRSRPSITPCLAA
jgi:hypothetical protein